MQFCDMLQPDEWKNGKISLLEMCVVAGMCSNIAPLSHTCVLLIKRCSQQSTWYSFLLMQFPSSFLISALQCGFSSSRSLGVLFFQRDPLLTIPRSVSAWFKRSCSLWLLKSFHCCLLVSLWWQRWGRGQRAAGASLSICCGDVLGIPGLSPRLGAVAMSLGKERLVRGCSGQTGAGRAGKWHCCRGLWWFPAGKSCGRVWCFISHSKKWGLLPLIFPRQWPWEGKHWGGKTPQAVTSSSGLVWFPLSYQPPLPHCLHLPFFFCCQWMVLIYSCLEENFENSNSPFHLISAGS